MKTLKKILIGVGIALVVGFMSLAIYYIYQDSLNEKKLSNEFDEIDNLLTNSDIHNDLISGERQDEFKFEDGVWKLSKRFFIVDQTTLNTRNLAIFV